MHEHVDDAPGISIEGPGATGVGADDQAEFGHQMTLAHADWSSTSDWLRPFGFDAPMAVVDPLPNSGSAGSGY